MGILFRAMLETLISNPVYGYFFIFFARVADVSLDVFRLLMLTRGYALPAAAIGFIEVAIFVVALGSVLYGGLTDPLKVIAYAGGFATGNLVGVYIEENGPGLCCCSCFSGEAAL